MQRSSFDGSFCEWSFPQLNRLDHNNRDDGSDALNHPDDTLTEAFWGILMLMEHDKRSKAIPMALWHEQVPYVTLLDRAKWR